MSESDRATVKTYIPCSQKETWSAHAEDLDMSQSEFVRTMVQAGRRDFTVPSLTGEDPTRAAPVTSDTNDIRERILTIIEAEGSIEWEELVDEVIDDVEARIERTLTDLQEENAILHSPRKGGYLLNGNESD